MKELISKKKRRKVPKLNVESVMNLNLSTIGLLNEVSESENESGRGDESGNDMFANIKNVEQNQ